MAAVLTTNPLKILDGKALSKAVEASVTKRVADFSSKVGRSPGLGVILIGEDPASKTYVASKEALAKRCGVQTFDARLPDSISQHELLAAIRSFNEDARIDGILLQLPLPKHLEASEALNLIDPKKDADGLHPLNQGLLMQGSAGPRPCTPLGCIKLIDLAFAKVGPEAFDQIVPVDLSGRKAVVLGRSQLVGKPVAMMLLERNATVTMCHSRTENLPAVVADADIVVAAIGKPRFVKGAWVKPGAVVIDVGINRLPDGKLAGDVDYDDVFPVAGCITPVPGGVGPLTVAMLVHNTVENYVRSNGS